MPVASQKMMSKYGNRSSFLAKFNPDSQRIVCRDEDNCIFGDYPTIVTLNNVYGQNTAFAWLVPQLYNLSEFCGCRDKLQGKPLEECADVIAREFYYLKVSELMLFFQRFKTGRYGRFYGSVDPLVITTSLREFVKDRNIALSRKEQEDRMQRLMSQEKDSMSWEEYCMKEYGELRRHPLDRKINH